MYEKDEPLQLISMNIERSKVRKLKRNGINRSEFMRQAVEAWEAGKWNYKFIAEE